MATRERNFGLWLKWENGHAQCGPGEGVLQKAHRTTSGRQSGSIPAARSSWCEIYKWPLREGTTDWQIVQRHPTLRLRGELLSTAVGWPHSRHGRSRETISSGCGELGWRGKARTFIAAPREALGARAFALATDVANDYFKDCLSHSKTTNPPLPQSSAAGVGVSGSSITRPPCREGGRRGFRAALSAGRRF
jgi:hypothetical protein